MCPCVFRCVTLTEVLWHIHYRDELEDMRLPQRAVASLVQLRGYAVLLYSLHCNTIHGCDIGRLPALRVSPVVVQEIQKLITYSANLLFPSSLYGGNFFWYAANFLFPTVSKSVSRGKRRIASSPAPRCHCLM